MYIISDKQPKFKKNQLHSSRRYLKKYIFKKNSTTKEEIKTETRKFLELNKFSFRNLNGVNWYLEESVNMFILERKGQS